jgi:hypothetical protein
MLTTLPTPNLQIDFIFVKPAFQIFGELFAEEYSDEANCLGPGLFNSCTPGKWLVPIYMLVFLFAGMMKRGLLVVRGGTKNLPGREE